MQDENGPSRTRGYSEEYKKRSTEKQTFRTTTGLEYRA